MRHFQGIEEIKAATVEELAALPTMNGKVAQQYMIFSTKLPMTLVEVGEMIC